MVFKTRTFSKGKSLHPKNKKQRSFNIPASPTFSLLLRSSPPIKEPNMACVVCWRSSTDLSKYLQPRGSGSSRMQEARCLQLNCIYQVTSDAGHQELWTYKVTPIGTHECLNIMLLKVHQKLPHKFTAPFVSPQIDPQPSHSLKSQF